MIRRCVFAMIVFALLVGCASEEHSRKGISAGWKPGSVWTFVSTEKSGASSSFTFRVTDKIAKTCASGDWRKLRLVSGRLPQLHDYPPQAAFMVEGSFLNIDLLAGWCDIDDHIRGNLAGKTFAGKREQGGMMGSDVVGTVRGWRVK